MPDVITWSQSASVGGGPKLHTTQALEVEAYDKIVVQVPGGPSATPATTTVAVQPSSAAGAVKLLIISSSRYGEDLTFTVAGTGGVEDVVLDAQLMLAGEGAVSLLGAVPSSITFSNGFGTGQTVDVTILVGRAATS